MHEYRIVERNFKYFIEVKVERTFGRFWWKRKVVDWVEVDCFGFPFDEKEYQRQLTSNGGRPSQAAKCASFHHEQAAKHTIEKWISARNHFVNHYKHEKI